MSVYTSCMAISGVLRNTRGQPIREGVLMYHCLAVFSNVILLADPGMDRADWEHFTITEDLNDHTGLQPWPVEQRPTEALTRLDQVTKVRLSGYPLAFVIEPDPSTCAELLKNGYNTLLFTHAEYSYPDWLPDAKLKPTPWNELSQQVADNARARAEDERMKVDEY